jgi:DNA-nicking Smr family endonuclease
MNKRYIFTPNQQDLDLFNKVVADVEPLKRNYQLAHKIIKNNLKSKKTVPILSLPIKEEKNSKKTAIKRVVTTPLAVNEYSPGRVPGLDRKTALRLKKGHFFIDYRLDLHGMSQKSARNALELCISNASHRRYRSLLIITGKGFRSDKNNMTRNQSERGVLRRLVPFWLIEQPLAEFVLAFSIAQPEHGGAGAFYVLLKRSS